MKKIFMILAAMMLLTLSLNALNGASAQKYKAQNKQHITELSKGQAAQSVGVLRAPNRYNAADGEFLVGPYTTDDFGTTGKGLYSTTGYGKVDITAILDRSEIEQYIGQEIVGYRFATTGTVSCYSFLVSTEGPNHWVTDINVFNLQESGAYVDVNGTQWHEYYLDEPVIFEVPDSVIAVWIGYKYYQESSEGSYTMTPILVNPNSTSHSTYAYSYYNESFYDVTSTLGGDLAAQLIFKNNTNPTLTAPADGSTVDVGESLGGAAVSKTVTVSGRNLTENLTVSVNGTGFTVSPTTLSAADVNNGTATVTVTYSGTADGTGSMTISSNEVSSTVNLTATYVDITPVLTAPDNNSTVNVGTNTGSGVSKTINIKGNYLTQDLTISVSGAGFSVSRDVTVTAAEANAGKDITVTYNGTDANATGTLTISSNEVSATVNLTASYSDDVTICNGTNTNGYLPIYGLYCDDYQINQMIYPEDSLTSLVGKKLTSMTFYATEALDANLSSVGWNVKLGTTSQTSFASSLSSITRLVPGDVATVATGYVITSGINTMTITFDTPFEYNGGNLLVDFQSNAEGQYKSTSWYGVNQSTYTGYNSYRSSDATPNQNGHYSNGSTRQFLPKVTFTAEAVAPVSTIEITPATQTINDAAAGALTVTGTDITGNINVSAADNTNWSLNPTSLSNTGGNVSVSYTGRALSATTTVTASAANDNTVTASATVNYVADLYIVGNFGSGWDFTNGTSMSYNNGTYTATLTVDAGNYILFARLLGNSNPWNTRDVFGPDSNGDWGMQGDSYGGNIDLNDDDPIYFPEGGTYRITIDANNGTFTITKLNGEQTASPVIDYTVSSDGEYVTITATGNGTVTLNVPGHEPVSGDGEVSITVPCGYASNTITVSATAQETGKDESDPATAQVTIPAGSDWVEMTGTYDNIADLLSFQVKEGNDTIDIAMVDQFRVSTLNNNHPDHYTYTLRQTVNGETQTSTPVSIPVYKTDSKMMGLYTYNQVMGDSVMNLKANMFNTRMDFDVNPDRNTLYYSLYRGAKDAYYPEIKADQRISQLQRFYEMVGGYPQYYLFESHPEGIAPKYERSDYIGQQIVERLDTNWVEGELDEMLAYVPVIWTPWLNTARGDSINNSYGSDIKREYMGSVQASITGEFTDVTGAHGAYSTFDVNGVDYIIYHPVIEVTGNLPQNITNNRVDYNDGDYAEYEPFMCRAWCTYEGIRDFGRNTDGSLVDKGALTTPYLLGTQMMSTPLDTIGGLWTEGSERDRWSFGVPYDTDPSNVTFIIRFYYKKVVTEAQQNGGNGAKLGNEEEEYFMAQTEGDAHEMIVGINEFMNGVVPVSVTYVNPQGMQSSRPFDGVNIVVTRYSDGTTRTSKIIR